LKKSKNYEPGHALYGIDLPNNPAAKENGAYKAECSEALDNEYLRAEGLHKGGGEIDRERRGPEEDVPIENLA
jgi:hypothetical protein